MSFSPCAADGCPLSSCHASAARESMWSSVAKAAGCPACRLPLLSGLQLVFGRSSI